MKMSGRRTIFKLVFPSTDYGLLTPQRAANQSARKAVLFNRPFAWWRHFTTMTRIPQGFGFLCQLNLTGIIKFKCEKKNEKNSGRRS